MKDENHVPLGIFVSYSRQDSAVTHLLAERLRTKGYNVWTDVSAITGGAVWLAEIEKAIGRCDVLLVMVSNASKTSLWVQREVLYALNMNKPVIPVRIESVSLPLSLVHLQSVDCLTDPEQSLMNIMQALEKHAPSHTDSIPELTRPAVVAPALRRGMSLVQLRQWLSADNT